MKLVDSHEQCGVSELNIVFFFYKPYELLNDLQLFTPGR